MTTRIPVLVTGGAGYIGSHAVLALKDAGWPVAVVDNLTTGFRFAIPDGVPLYEGDIEDGALITRIIAEQNIGAIMHFAGSIIVPESVENPLKYYHNNTAKSRALERIPHELNRRGFPFWLRCDSGFLLVAGGQHGWHEHFHRICGTGLLQRLMRA